MNQFTCPNCQARIGYGQSACKGCGISLSWEGINHKPPKTRRWLKVLGIIMGIFFLLVAVLLLYPTGEYNVNNQKVDIGKIEYKASTIEDVLNTQAYGQAIINQVIVMLAEDLKEEAAQKIAIDINAKIVGQIEFAHLYQFEIPSTTEEHLTDYIQRLQKVAGVEMAFANTLAQTRDIQGQPCATSLLYDHAYFKENQWYDSYHLIGLQEAYDILTVTQVPLHSVHVGIADELINVAYETLQGVNIEGNSYKLLATNPTETDKPYYRHENIKLYDPYFTHGSGVAHVLAANPNKGKLIGTASMLKEKLSISSLSIQRFRGRGSKLMPVDSTGSVSHNASKPWDILAFDEEAIEAGKQFIVTFNEEYLQRHENENGANQAEIFGTLVEVSKLVEKGASIINCSFGPHFLGTQQEQCEAYDRFLDKLHKNQPRVLIVAAAGNENLGVDGSNDYWGKKKPNLITVGSVDAKGNKADFSNYAVGEGEITLAAPGVNIPVAATAERVIERKGTSYILLIAQMKIVFIALI